MKRVIGFTVHQMSENDYDLFMFEDFRQSSLNFIAYDLTYLLYGQPLNSKYCDITLTSYDEILPILSENKYIILYFDQTLQTRKIFDLLASYNNNLYIKIQSSKICLMDSTISKIKKISKLFNKEYRRDFIYRKFHTKKNLNMLFFEAGQSQRGVEIPSFEHDKVIKLKRAGLKSANSFHLFIDQNLPFHRDLKLSKGKTIENYELYYKSLDLFFTKVEQLTGKPVKIALHPRTDIMRNYFRSRETFLGYTAELSYQADIIFAHYSTAIHYPIIMNKNLLLLTSNELMHTDLNINIEAFASALALSPINIDTFNNFTHIYNMCNLKQYISYTYQYIISKKISPDTLGSHIIIDHLGKLLKD
jgi:hypothetical protein